MLHMAPNMDAWLSMSVGNSPVKLLGRPFCSISSKTKSYWSQEIWYHHIDFERKRTLPALRRRKSWTGNHSQMIASPSRPLTRRWIWCCIHRLCRTDVHPDSRLPLESCRWHMSCRNVQLSQGRLVSKVPQIWHDQSVCWGTFLALTILRGHAQEQL